MSGYKPKFLQGIELPLPSFTAELQRSILKDDPDLTDGMIADYIHYSVVMNASEERRSPVFVALNIDQKKLISVGRSNNWRIDSRIGAENQLDNSYYKNNPLDRGHMARRATAAWGNSRREAQKASNETFYYSNSCLQHSNLNQDEWLGLEDWVLDLKLDLDGKITSFSGPFYTDFDRTVRPAGRTTALIPTGFFKVVCFVNKDTKALDVRAFAMYQDVEALRDKSGRRRYNNQTYQVTVAEIEELTGLVFDDAVYEANPLFYAPAEPGDNERTRELNELNIATLPERAEIGTPGDILNRDDKRQTVYDDVIDIFIAAAMVDPKGNDKKGEWISLINLGENEIDISGWKLADNSASISIDKVVTEPAARKLLPGQSVVIGPVSPIQLANDGDVIRLFDNNDARIDWVNYTKDMVSTGRPVLFLSPRDTLDLLE